MQTYAVYLKPRGSLATVISSDLLWGAVCYAIQELRLVEDVGLWLQAQKSPPFAFSGAFPCWFSDPEVLRYFPRPATFDISAMAVDQFVETLQKRDGLSSKAARMKTAALLKDFARQSYLSEGVLKEIVTNNLSARDVLDDLARKGGRFATTSGTVLTAKEDASLAKIADGQGHITQIAVQHNQIDRVAGATVEGLLFYHNEMYFARNSGLWTLLRTTEETCERFIRPALRYLADTGLGSDRTSGKGQFQFQMSAFTTLPTSKNANAVMMLSRYIPTAVETIDPQKKPLAYRLTTLRPKREQRNPVIIAGQLTPAVYKRAVRAFEPGSVFPLEQSPEIFGRWVELLKQQEGGPIYQSGLAIPLFMHVGEVSDG